MNKHNAGVKKIYLKQVKKELICPGKIKKQLLEQMSSDLDGFVEDTENVTIEMIIDRFGSPSDLAHSYIDSLDADELNRQIKKSKKIRLTVLITCIVIALLVLAGAAAVIISALSNRITLVTYTVSEDEVVVTGVGETEGTELITDAGNIEEVDVVDDEIVERIEEIERVN